MDSLIALTVICVIFAVGDVVSVKTKAIFSMLFVLSVILLIGFWTILPHTIFQDAALIKIGIVLVALLITHMGTLISIKELVQQWKTVIIALGAVAGITMFLLLIGSPILGREFAISAAPPIAGGVVAVLLVNEAATAAGLTTIVVFTTLLLVFQGFFGYPVASFCLSKEARRVSRFFKEKLKL